MKNKHDESLNSALQSLQPARRRFIKQGLVIAGTASLAAPSSTLLAQQGQQPGAGGKGKGDGSFQGGKGQGKGDGTFQGGKGKGKGDGPFPGGKGKGKGKASI